MLSFTISAIQKETAYAKTFFLQPMDGIKTTYKAGQFLTLLFTEYGQEVRRSYSISSTPKDDFISITVKKIPNGFISRLLVEHAKVGDILNALPPAGMFTIHTNPQLKRDIFLIAAGSGVTPIFSLLKSVLIEEPLSFVTFIYSNSHSESTIFLPQIKELEKQFPERLNVEWLFSNNPFIFKARLSSTLLETLLHKYLRFTKKDALIYTCGPYDFMQMVQIVALTNGFDKANIRREVFVDPEDTAIEKPYFDTTDRSITLILKGIEYHLNVPYQESILTAALNKGIILPYSCRAGRCSSCQCVVKKGNIWMHYNEVLTDADVANGLALTCTGHPTTDDVVVEVGYD